MKLELARETALQIRKEDGAHWDQGSWYLGTCEMPVTDLLERKCGTAGCVAGWAVALAHQEAYFMNTFCISVNGVMSSIEATAADDLELTEVQASWLFNAGRTRDEVLWALENDDPGWDHEDCPL